MLKRDTAVIPAIFVVCILTFTNGHTSLASHNESYFDFSRGEVICLQEFAEFLPVYEQYLTPDQALRKAGSFYKWEDIKLNYEEKQLWILFNATNNSKKVNRILFNGQNSDSIKVYRIENNKIELESSSGYLMPYKSRAVQDWGTIVYGEIEPKSTAKFLISLSSSTRNSSRLMDYVTLPCMRLYSNESYLRDYKLPSEIFYLFLGAIAMMALYNLSISFSTLYKEYILFSLYNVLTFLAAFYITAIHYKFDILEVSDSQRHLQYILAVLVFPSYMWFCIKFLDIREKYAKTYHVLCGLSFSYFIIILLISFSYFLEAFYSFTLITSLALLLLLLTSIKESVKDISARLLLIGNLLIFSIAIAQILNLTNIITSKQLMFIVLSAQTLEIIIFSLAVAYKLKVSRKSLIIMRHRNELQKERLFSEAKLRQELEIENDRKSRSLTSSSIQFLNLSEQLNELKKYIGKELQPLDKEIAKKLLKKIKNMNSFEDHWSTFKIHFENVHPQFFIKLERNFPELSHNDHRLLAFMKMKLSNREISLILNVTKRAVEQSKSRLKAKLNLNSTKDILDFVENPNSIYPMQDGSRMKSSSDGKWKSIP